MGLPAARRSLARRCVSTMYSAVLGIVSPSGVVRMWAGRRAGHGEVDALRTVGDDRHRGGEPERHARERGADPEDAGEDARLARTRRPVVAVVHEVAHAY